MKSKIIAIIDPLISTKYLADQLRKFDIFTVAVFRLPISEFFAHAQLDDNIFDKHIYLENTSVEEIVESLKSYHIDYIINGCEFATEITDLITNKIFSQIANDSSSSKFRFDKYWMQEALKNRGLPYIKQIKLSSLNWNNLSLNEIKFPCFVKPIHGSGTLSSFYAKNQIEFEKNRLELINDQKIFSDIKDYLIQEFVIGEEFFIDSFSIQGKHYISSVQKYHRQLIDNIPVLRYSEVVSDITLWQECSRFVEIVLDATGLKNGFAHTEIFKLSDGSFRLVEINPRISGGRGYANKVAELSGLNTQVDLLVKYMRKRPLVNKTPVDIKNSVRRLYLFNWNQQPLKDPITVLSKITSFHSYELLRNIGTINNNFKKNVHNIDAFVLLQNQNKCQLEKDTDLIFQLEHAGQLL